MIFVGVLFYHRTFKLLVIGCLQKLGWGMEDRNSKKIVHKKIISSKYIHNYIFLRVYNNSHCLIE